MAWNVLGHVVNVGVYVKTIPYQILILMITLTQNTMIDTVIVGILEPSSFTHIPYLSLKFTFLGN